MALTGVSSKKCLKALKFCLYHSRARSTSCRKCRNIDMTHHSKSIVLNHSIYPSSLFQNFAKHEEYLNCFFLQYIRKNHFQPRSQKFIFKPVPEHVEKQISHTSIVDTLQKCKTVTKQIEVFHSMVKLQNDDMNCRLSICQDLQKALQPFFLSSISIYLTGSSINGLGFKGCDVDISLQFTSRIEDDKLVQEKSFSSEEAESTKSGAIKLQTAKTHLLTIRKILQELKFQEPLTVIPGRCPILNFYQKNLSCDLAINNSSALHGTNLMLLCSKLDERVTPLMQVIIYWAKNAKLVGSVGKFKTYAIFLMVVYFLQSRNPPILPSVETMFDKTDFLKNLENWSYDVTQNLNLFVKSQNTQTVEELLREFFIFYGNFDFSHVICPINGRSMDRKVFATKFDCNNSFELNTICIQDPLNLTWNVTTGVNWKNCKNFLKSIILVWEKYQDESCWVPQTNKWGLASLIDNQFKFNTLINVKEFTIDLPLTLQEPDISSKKTSFMFRQAANHVKRTLNYCLGFECHPATKTSLVSMKLPQNVRNVVENQYLKYNSGCTEENLDFSENNSNPIAQYVCATRNTWLGRNTYNLPSDSIANIIDYEHMVSEKMKLEKELDEKEIFYFLCQCYYKKAVENNSLEVKFKLLNNDKFIPKLVIFLKDYIPKLMKEISHEDEVTK